MIAVATLILEEQLIDDSLIQSHVVKINHEDVLNDYESEFIDSSDEFLSGSECPLDDFSEFEREQQLEPALLETYS